MGDGCSFQSFISWKLRLLPWCAWPKDSSLGIKKWRKTVWNKNIDPNDMFHFGSPRKSNKTVWSIFEKNIPGNSVWPFWDGDLWPFQRLLVTLNHLGHSNLIRKHCRSFLEWMFWVMFIDFSMFTHYLGKTHPIWQWFKLQWGISFKPSACWFWYYLYVLTFLWGAYKATYKME